MSAMAPNETESPVPGDTYSPEEQESLRAQLRRGHADARAELDRRGNRGPHPRVKALMEAGLWPQAYPNAPAGAKEDDR